MGYSEQDNLTSGWVGNPKQKPTELRYTEKSTDFTDKTVTDGQSSDVASLSDP
jgi:hypothetical protein